LSLLKKIVLVVHKIARLLDAVWQRTELTALLF